MTTFLRIIYQFNLLIKLSRLNNPVGIFLLFFPCCFGMGLVPLEQVKYNSLVIFFIGSILMRSFGCIVNDIVDKDIDCRVARTKLRPLANNQIAVTSAVIYLIVISMAALMLLMQLSDLAIILAILASTLIFIYPFMKRLTYYPQVILGITFNSGALISYANVTNNLTIASVVMYIGCIFWTIGYDTIYAFADAADDEKIKVKSLALVLKNNKYKLWILASLYLIFISMFVESILLSAFKLSIFAVLFIVAATCLLMWQIATLDVTQPLNCLTRFKANTIVGLLLFIAMILL
ncbi:4-hydroxybenzoate octaprenyltransferase [Orientia tsutsugamushi]|uniref:4-hydroxybenzoate octaprenyltransferase n=1 Tax=Orientia tsutsugamushi TaxID=784 RepID=A0A2U3RN38_ORITS|nr:4-hydroxybenzoate octaprenyltransferase [Orientia tsutsugamushi]KJV55886.1 ubiA prenyltransferase family protein [Orientia tsutsugamushi str. Karp]SPR14643.1 4-hydroxybenzoate octaprenyltransferase [Orientia tsutsugamushi]